MQLVALSEASDLFGLLPVPEVLIPPDPLTNPLTYATPASK